MIIKFLFGLIAIVLTVTLVIGIHELGHFIAARLFGIKIIRFSLGFGKPFYRYRDHQGIEYSIAPIPLGGYVKLLDEREQEVPLAERHLAFNRQKIWKRTIVLLLGPLFNILLAIIAFYIAFAVGIARPYPIIEKVIPGSVAEKAGIKSNQIIIAVDGVTVESSWKAVIYILSRMGDEGSLNLKTKDLSSHLISEHQLFLKNWRLDDLKSNPLNSLGFEFLKPPYQPNQIYHSQYSLGSAWQAALSEIGLILWFQGKTLSKLFTGQLSLKAFAGPLSLFQGATIALSHGFVPYVLFIGLLSLAVFLLNILPIPGLDGGHLLFLAIEKTRGNPVSLAFEVLVFRLSFILFCVVLFQLVLYDLIRLFSHLNLIG